MLFNSLHFMLFFPIVTLLYFAIPARLKYLWLLVSSYYFYMCWNPKYALLMLTSTAITYLGGYGLDCLNSNSKHLEEKRIERGKKLIVGLTFGSNLLILFFFKYFYFVLDNVNSVLAAFGVQIIQPNFDIILPVGISFYTFQALSYIMDVYHKEIYAEKNFLKYALFVSFFPQLVAGPIERSKNLLKQINRVYQFDYTRAKRGLLLMLWGFFQKLVLADRLAILVNTVYNNYAEYGSVEIVVATFFFAIQIYCDFSSYTDIARGCAQVLGFELMENFRQPYFSRSIAEFWRRWHISLSSWFRDYLYIPLGGNKRGTARKYLNILCVFLVSGLWHGANWTFVLWGLIHGLYQVFGAILKPARQKLMELFSVTEGSRVHHTLQRITTVLLVCFAWVFFRANSLSDAVGLIQSIFVKFDPWALTDGTMLQLGLQMADFWVLLLSGAILLAVSIQKYRTVDLCSKILSCNVAVRWVFYYLALFLILILGIYGPGYAASQFIYFQF